MKSTKNGDYKYHRDTEGTEKIKNLEFKVPSIKRGFRGVFDTAVYKPFIQYSRASVSGNSFFIFVSEDIKNIANSARKTIVMFNNCHAGKAARNALEMLEMLK